MKILGIHDGHNSSACLLVDGKIQYCLQEERLTNIKNYAGFPTQSVRAILKAADVNLADIDIIAFGSKDLGTQCGRNDLIKGYKAQKRFSYRRVRSYILYTLLSLFKRTKAYSTFKKGRNRHRIRFLNEIGNYSFSKVCFLDHHLCHAASAYYGSHFTDEKVLVLTCDGSGDGLCATVYIADKGQLTRIAQTPAGHSIGDIYSRVTLMLGFVPLEHEYKLMGMAPYAGQQGTDTCAGIFEKYLTVDKENLCFRRNIPEPTQYIGDRLAKDCKYQRIDWICGGLQKITENLLVEWVTAAAVRTGLRKVALAGGVFMNVKANKAISQIPQLDDLFIFPSCGDESLSIGAAFYAYACQAEQTNSPVNIKPLLDIYWGLDIDDRQTQTMLKNGKNINYKYVGNPSTTVAELLSQGQIVAVCRGRMEFGARALGNRSILADPANLDCVRVINMMIKKRDFWMPFAPVMTSQRSGQYIINPKGIDSPHMMMSYDTTEKYPDMIACCQQADMTARAQIIDHDYNPAYYAILKEFEKITGRAVILNTSFNLHGYPMVNDAQQALWVFENSGLRYLLLGSYLLSKVAVNTTSTIKSDSDSGSTVPVPAAEDNFHQQLLVTR
jgi:carbamoyltransferase